MHLKICKNVPENDMKWTLLFINDKYEMIILHKTFSTFWSGWAALAQGDGDVWHEKRTVLIEICELL